jgi:hypothetical protein
VILLLFKPRVYTCQGYNECDDNREPKPISYVTRVECIQYGWMKHGESDGWNIGSVVRVDGNYD